VKIRWSQLGGQIGIGLALFGFVLVFLGWNGAASYDRIPAQFPYLISGGIAGLAVVVLGAALLVVQNARQDRAQLQQAMAELRAAVEKMAAMAASQSNGSGSAARSAAAEVEGLVVAGPTSYHRPSCRLLEGRGALLTIAVELAEEQGLSACRVCGAGETAAPATKARARKAR